jgi:hypothetical protein
LCLITKKRAFSRFQELFFYIKKFQNVLGAQINVPATFSNVIINTLVRRNILRCHLVGRRSRTGVIRSFDDVTAGGLTATRIAPITNMSVATLISLLLQRLYAPTPPATSYSLMRSTVTSMRPYYKRFEKNKPGQ